MEIKKVIMKNGNEYLVFWYEYELEFNSNDFTKVIDINHSWVELNKNLISEIISSWNKLHPNLHIHPIARKAIIDQYGQEALEELNLK
jgi:hypothetical protein